MASTIGASLNHVSRESSDIKRLSKFYQEVIESPKLEFNIIWLKLGSFYLHLIDPDPHTKLPEGPWSSANSAVADPKHLPRGHHICFSVANFESFLQTLQVFGFEVIESPQLEFNIIWLKLGSFYLHLIDRDTDTKLPEGPWSTPDTKHLIVHYDAH